MAENEPGEIANGQILLRTIKDRNMWSARITNVLKDNMLKRKRRYSFPYTLIVAMKLK